MHPAVWHAPQPLWRLALGDPAPRPRFRGPAVLRFDVDTFMEDVQATLAADPEALAAHVARAETWRQSRAGWAPLAEHATPISLYQPAHQRYYLVAASLVCQTRGLPDRRVDAAAEATSFLLRRLATNEQGAPILDETAPGYAEYGWFGKGGWRPVNGPGGLDRLDGAPGGDGAPALLREERRPLFPLAFTDRQLGIPRRLLAGLVPVSAREELESTPRADAPEPVPDPTDPLADPRFGQYDAGVAWGLNTIRDALLGPGGPGLRAQDVREPFAFALLDLVVFLDRYLPAVWQSVQNGGSTTGLSGRNRAVRDVLARVQTHGVTWALLAAVGARQDLIEEGRIDFSGATLPGQGLNPLVQLSKNQIRQAILALPVDAATCPESPPEAAAISLSCAVRRALAVSNRPFVSDEPFAVPGVADRAGADAGAVYVARCVYERAGCRTGRFPVVSARSRPFRLAGFFDADAPVRPHKITLPVDTSVAGLRASPKSVAFLLSDGLRKQVDRINGIKLQALDDGDLGEEGGWTLGMICSLSIPIITICAFILLLIIVFVLNIVFWWIPFFRICLPIPLKK
jgi:hypothetical protein